MRRAATSRSTWRAAAGEPGRGTPALPRGVWARLQPVPYILTWRTCQKTKVFNTSFIDARPMSFGTYPCFLETLHCIESSKQDESPGRFILQVLECRDLSTFGFPRRNSIQRSRCLQVQLISSHSTVMKKPLLASLLLVVRPGAPSSVLAPSSDARALSSFLWTRALHKVISVQMWMSNPTHLAHHVEKLCVTAVLLRLGRQHESLVKRLLG